jgi:fumarylpyruvate hydrolase
LTEAGEISAGAIELAVDGEVRQRDDVGRMIWSVGEIIGALSRYFLLRPGDLVFTGTPAGVGPVQVGEQLVARIERLGELRVVVGPAGATTVNAT